MTSSILQLKLQVGTWSLGFRPQPHLNLSQAGLVAFSLRRLGLPGSEAMYLPNPEAFNPVTLNPISLNPNSLNPISRNPNSLNPTSRNPKP